ncbi:hypothetical protein O181_049448 [Austropuccinia psidii MF-1]|uniref:Chromo domain-containing protein n=1 Tax=Austropuccinia psidii MF-1 TaxID=1389203 RepID=A0A9Q3DXI9_9BASI|nr:hypothetical protein [Austropuccinia psidii MF-1]
MNQLLTILNGSTIISKIDMCGAYNPLRIKEGDEHLTAFRTKYGSYEYLVMPFGLTNAPASFQNLVNDFLNVFVVVYLDYIIVFCSSEEEHVKHVASVLKRLRDNNLFSKASNLKRLTALTSLLKKYSPLIFNEEGLSQFQLLKEAFTTAPILSHFNASLPTIVETDASNYSLGAVLSQTGHFTSCVVTLGQPVPREGGGHHQQESSKLHQVIKQDGIQESRFFSIKAEIFSDLVEKIQKEVWQDNDYKEILKHLARGESVPDYSLEPQAKLLLFKDRVVIPSNEEIQLNILQKCHDSALAGHPGQEKTLKLIKRDFYWAGMNQFIKDYVSSYSPAGKLSTKLQSVQQVVKEELESALRRFKKYADRNRSIPPDFQSGDKVWLASKNIKTTRPTKKLSERWLGPFEVLKKIGSHAYHLKLPQQWKSVHLVFHVSLLEPVKQSAIPNQNQLPPPPALVEEQEEWEVAQVLYSKLKRGKLWYLVEWKGFNEDPERTTLEPASNLTNSPDLVKDFHLLYPDKPGPNTSRV